MLPTAEAARRVGDRLHHVAFRAVDRLPRSLRPAARAMVFDSRYSRRADPWGYATTPAEVERHEALVEACRRGSGWALDVGCGTGEFSRRLLEAGAAQWVVGVDVSKVAVRLAARRQQEHPSGPRGQYHHADVTRTAPPWFATRFDVVVCADLLYYLPSPEQLESLTGRIADWLAPEGRLVLAHPSARAPHLHGPATRHPALVHERRIHAGADADYRIDVYRRAPSSSPARSGHAVGVA